MSAVPRNECVETPTLQIVGRCTTGAPGLYSLARLFSTNPTTGRQVVLVGKGTVNPSALAWKADMDTRNGPARWLPESLGELQEVCSAAEEEGYTPVSGTALSKTRDLLEALATRVRERPMLDPTPEGGIAIDFRGADRNGVLLVVDPDGTGAYFEQIGGNSGRGRYSDARFMLEAAAWGALRRAELL